VRNVNEQFDEYRDCLRLTWNFALRHRGKGPVALPDVSQALLDALVLDDLSNATPLNTTRVTESRGPEDPWHKGHIPGLGVVVSALSPEFYVATSQNSENSWIRQQAPTGDGGKCMIYVDLFDFRSTDEILDFEYIQAVAKLNDVGRYRLIVVRRSDVDIVDLTSEEN
jgi:hypothetical protein